jgi:hypothetical protein
MSGVTLLSTPCLCQRSIIKQTQNQNPLHVPHTRKVRALLTPGASGHKCTRTGRCSCDCQLHCTNICAPPGVRKQAVSGNYTAPSLVHPLLGNDVGVTWWPLEAHKYTAHKRYVHTNIYRGTTISASALYMLCSDTRSREVDNCCAVAVDTL